MNSKEKELAIVILIGGKSNRLGTEKSVINILGKPLILYQIETLQKFDNDIFLIAHSEEQVDGLRKLIDFPKDIKFIVDDREFFSYPKINKPILGIYSGFKELNRLGFEKTFLLSCDMPLIKPEVVDLLIKNSSGHDCVIPRWNNGFMEFFFAIYPINQGLQKAKEILTTKNFGLINFVDKEWNINYISVEDSIKPLDKNLISFININGPIDIYKVIKLFQNHIIN